ncbi:MAG: hypothetical protein KKI07_00240 [Euryarchaeota archaeon]|nr:hypothetical protein [Euryarchaeota archaeon]
MLESILQIGAWWIIVEILGLLALPVVAYMCHNLDDKGYSVSKVVGILFITYASWIMTYVGIPYDLPLITFAILLLCILSLYLLLRSNRTLGLNKDTVITNELIFGIAFLFFVIVRMYAPELNISEKFMDSAFMNAINRAKHFPAPDPWLSGYDQSFYYYFGYVAMTTLTKLSGIPAPITFNLGVALIFALSVNAAFGIGYNLTRSRVYGAIIAFFVTYIGHLLGFFQLMAYMFKPLVEFGYFMPKAVYEGMMSIDFLWASSRVIPYTITEMPCFTFLHGDLHPHMIAIPFQLLVLMLLLNLFRFHVKKDAFFDLSIFGNDLSTVLISITMLGLALGFLFPLNSWDYPTYVIVTTASIAFVWLREKRRIVPALGNTILDSSIIIGLSALLYAPYYLQLSVEGVKGIGVVAERTELPYFMMIYTLFLFMMFSLLIQYSRKNFRFRHVIPLMIGVSLLAVISVLIEFHLLMLLLPLIILSLYCLLRDEHTHELGYVFLLVLIGALLSLFCELFFIDDTYGPPWERMNTVFKVGLQIWLLWGIAAGYSVYHFREHFRGIKTGKAWKIIACILILMCTVYPVCATFNRVSGFNKSPTLNGIEYIKETNRGEYEAIRWINENIEGSAVILEKPGEFYWQTTRVSTFTGLQTLMGMSEHEHMWRGNWSLVCERMNDANAIYNTTDNAVARDLMEKYDVSYIYVGVLERGKYLEEGLDKFANHPESYELIFENDVAQIYRVK